MVLKIFNKGTRKNVQIDERHSKVLYKTKDKIVIPDDMLLFL